MVASKTEGERESVVSVDTDGDMVELCSNDAEIEELSKDKSEVVSLDPKTSVEVTINDVVEIICSLCAPVSRDCELNVGFSVLYSEEAGESVGLEMSIVTSAIEGAEASVIISTEVGLDVSVENDSFPKTSPEPSNVVMLMNEVTSVDPVNGDTVSTFVVSSVGVEDMADVTLVPPESNVDKLHGVSGVMDDLVEISFGKIVGSSVLTNKEAGEGSAPFAFSLVDLLEMALSVTDVIRFACVLSNSFFVSAEDAEDADTCAVCNTVEDSLSLLVLD